MCAALKLIGFLAGFALLTFFIVAVMYRRPLKVAAAVSAALTVGFYLLFPLALGVKLPQMEVISGLMQGFDGGAAADKRAVVLRRRACSAQWLA